MTCTAPTEMLEQRNKEIRILGRKTSGKKPARKNRTKKEKEIKTNLRKTDRKCVEWEEITYLHWQALANVVTNTRGETLAQLNT
jgi:hypothetical protein